MKKSKRMRSISLGDIWLNCKRQSNGCFEWQGTRNPKGYGTIAYDDKLRTLTRVVMHLCYGFDFDDPQLLVLHHCDNPPCVQPSHLYIGSAQDNANDMKKRKRYKARGPSKKKVVSCLT